MTKPILMLPAALLAFGGPFASLNGASPPFQPIIPKTWDDAVMAGLELPLAHAPASPKHAPSDYYYRLPVRPIYKSYPIYHPAKAPPNYLQWLTNQEPVVLWDGGANRPTLRTEDDWRRAGAMVFESATAYEPDMMPILVPFAGLQDPEWYRKTRTPVTPDGTMPFARYVIREKGKIDVSNVSCAVCHTRILPDGSVLRGAQGNAPFSQWVAHGMRTGASPATNAVEHERLMHALQRGVHAAPWLRPDPNAQAETMPLAELAAMWDTFPPGAMARTGTSMFSPVPVPDLIGVKNRRYLDRTGLQRHRGIGDLMRYDAINDQGDSIANYDGFIPLSAFTQTNTLPANPAEAGLSRYSDEQLYAMALFLYSLKPPPNPNLPQTAEQKALVKRGEEIFNDSDNRCATCHKPPLYTNNKLTPALGFKVPDNHPEGTNIMSRSVGTDPALATTTRRGTGFYKVPSLLGVWYRGPFEHNGSCATLEDWFNPARTNDTYVPTGWKGPAGARTRAVKGHEYGLDLSAEERKALIAFLKTL